MTKTRILQQAVIGMLAVWFLCGSELPCAMAEKRPDPKGTNVPPVSTLSRNKTPDYRVGPGDVLEISVWKEPDVSAPSIVVRPDGKISLPLINDVLVSGKTPMEIQAELTKKLVPYIKEPNVTVSVKEINSKKVYVIGEVMHPGAFDITQPKTVLQALTEAGGPQPFAKLKSMYVLRKEGGKQEKLSFNYKDVIRGKKIEQNVQLKPGDTIVVP